MLTSLYTDNDVQDDILQGKFVFPKNELTHLQLLQGFGSHVCILEVDEGTETLMKNPDALYLTKPVTMET